MLHYRYSLRVWSLTSIRRYTREMSLTLREKSESLIENRMEENKKNEKREKRRRKKNIGVRADEKRSRYYNRTWHIFAWPKTSD